LVEKPERPEGLDCGVGLYLLDRPTLRAMAGAPPDARGRLELTAGLAAALARGVDLRVSTLHGDYLNVNTPADLAAARARFGVRGPGASR